MLPSGGKVFGKVVQSLSPIALSKRTYAAALEPYNVRKFAWEMEHDLEFEASLLRHRKSVGTQFFHRYFGVKTELCSCFSGEPHKHTPQRDADYSSSDDEGDAEGSFAIGGDDDGSCFGDGNSDFSGGTADDQDEGVPPAQSTIHVIGPGDVEVDNLSTTSGSDSD